MTATAAHQSKAHGNRKTIGHQVVIHGDCMAEIKKLSDHSVDVIVTSPPYNINLPYNSYQDDQPREAYIQWLCALAVELRRVLKEDGSFFLNVGATSRDPWLPFELVLALRDYFRLQNTIVWAKSISINDNTFGHYKPINSQYFLNHLYEHLFHFTKSGNVALNRTAIGVPYKDKSNIKRRGHREDRHCRGNVWFIPYETVQSKREKFEHPATFPTELVRQCIKLHGKEDIVVLDPFLGAGTTLVVCQQMGMRGIGIEVDRRYVKTAVMRLKGKEAQATPVPSKRMKPLFPQF